MCLHTKIRVTRAGTTHPNSWIPQFIPPGRQSISYLLTHRPRTEGAGKRRSKNKVVLTLFTLLLFLTSCAGLALAGCAADLPTPPPGGGRVDPKTKTHFPTYLAYSDLNAHPRPPPRPRHATGTCVPDPDAGDRNGADPAEQLGTHVRSPHLTLGTRLPQIIKIQLSHAMRRSNLAQNPPQTRLGTPDSHRDSEISRIAYRDTIRAPRPAHILLSEIDIGTSNRDSVGGRIARRPAAAPQNPTRDSDSGLGTRM